MGLRRKATFSSGGKLVFVYNADSGPIALLLDAAHRTFSPDTYECNLCDLTYGRVTMKRAWKEFLDTLPFPAEFTMRDRFRRDYPGTTTSFPAVFLVDASGAHEVVTSTEIDAVVELDSLISLVKRKLDDAGIARASRP